MRAAADPGLMRGAPLPGSSGVSGGRLGSIGWRWGPRGICRAGGRAVGSPCGGHRCRRRRSEGFDGAAASGAAHRRIGAAPACCGNSGIKSSGDCASAGVGAAAGASGAGRGGAAGAGAGSAGGARRPRGPPLRISSR